jgi:hypothetical protein
MLWRAAHFDRKTIEKVPEFNAFMKSRRTGRTDSCYWIRGIVGIIHNLDRTGDRECILLAALRDKYLPFVLRITLAGSKVTL